MKNKTTIYMEDSPLAKWCFPLVNTGEFGGWLFRVELDAIKADRSTERITEIGVHQRHRGHG